MAEMQNVSQSIHSPTCLSLAVFVKPLTCRVCMSPRTPRVRTPPCIHNGDQPFAAPQKHGNAYIWP
jgi:hypothetical protein